MKKSTFFALAALFTFNLANADESKISAPYAQGTASNDLKWEVRFNMPDCDNDGGKKGAWCLQSKDMKNAIDKSGVEAKLKSWINDPKIKSLYLAYLSFSNSGVKKALCEGVKQRADLNLNIYVNYDVYDSTVDYFNDCSENKNIRIYSRGKGPFGTPGAYLQHTKIFLALETSSIKSLFESEESSLRRIKFTSSSANMSAYGTNLHFENWIFFDARENDYVAQQNICTFKAYGNEQDTNNETYINTFKERYAECLMKLNQSSKIEKRNDLKFYLVPMIKKNNEIFERPYDAMKRAVLSAKETVYVAIHRLMTGKITKDLLLAAAKKPSVKMEIIYDDDTLRFGKEDGGDFFDVDRNDVMNYRVLRRQADQVYFMETNATASGESRKPHLFHNKFIVVDDKYLFQGAGNFTASSLNIDSTGNFENFYLIEIPEIVKAYKKAWLQLRDRATKQEEHPVFNNPDKVF